MDYHFKVSRVRVDRSELLYADKTSEKFSLWGVVVSGVPNTGRKGGHPDQPIMLKYYSESLNMPDDLREGAEQEVDMWIRVKGHKKPDGKVYSDLVIENYRLSDGQKS